MNEQRSPFLLVNLPASLLACCKSFHRFGNHSPTIAATTIAEMELFLSQRLLLLQSLESGFHMIAMIPAIAELFFLSDRSKNTYTTLTEWDDLSLDRQCDPSQSWVLRKWNSSHNKCVDTIWFSKPTTTTTKCKSTKRLPGCYAEFITFSILLGNRINQILFWAFWTRKKTVDSLGGCNSVNT